MYLRTLGCLSCEVFIGTASHTWEFAGAERGQFHTAREVRQVCPASGFLFAMAFDPIFRWLQESIIPRNPRNLEFLQLVQNAYADELAVAASSFRDLMTALAPAFRSMDHFTGLNLYYRKCSWCKMVVKNVSPYCVGRQIIVRISSRCRLSGVPSTWAP